MSHLRASTWSRAVVPLSLVILPVVVGFWSYLGSANESGPSAQSLSASTLGIPVSAQAVAEVTGALGRPEPAAKTGCDATYLWGANRDDARLKLRGCVPSEEDRLTILSVAKAHFPDLQIDDRMRLVAGSPSDAWLSNVVFALTQLNHLKSGAVQIAGQDFAISGEARSPQDFEQGQNDLHAKRPSGLSLAQTQVKPPAAKPFVFTAELVNDFVTLAGNVPSDDARDVISEVTVSLMPGHPVTDKTQLASGAPGRWAEAVLAGLHGLSRLETGKLTISGLGVRMEGVAADPEKAKDAEATLSRELPSIYQARNEITLKESASAKAARKDRADADALTSNLWTKVAQAALRAMGRGPSEQVVLR